MAKTNSAVELLVSGKNSQEQKLQAPLKRLTRFLAVFEIYDPELVLQQSESLADFEITADGRRIYAGRAVIGNLIDRGSAMSVEVKLDPAGMDLLAVAPSMGGAPDFGEFLRQWQRQYKVLPEFKSVIADMESFLTDLRLWLDQVELKMRSTANGNFVQIERDQLLTLGQEMVPCFDALHERLEEVSAKVDPEMRPVHQNFCERHLHPLVLCSPFGHRTYYKPLGYAGDYEMVNMILRDPFQGGSLYAKLVNLWFLSQWPSKAHRNRVTYLTERLDEETKRMIAQGKPLRVYNLGCGPAGEVQAYLRQNQWCDRADLTLVDFNEETIENTGNTLQFISQQHRRTTFIKLQRKAVARLLAEAERGGSKAPTATYDYVYCAGLFDYLPDHVCRSLMNLFYSWLAPGGLLVATNVDDCKPFRHMLEFVLDWHLIYRGVQRGATLAPEAAPKGATIVRKDDTGVNIFIEVRKPDHVT